MSVNKVIKVALIEDDPGIQSMYARYFDLVGGLEVKLANNGAEGLELLKIYTPDIILLDMMMPTMSGIETLEKIRDLPNAASYKIIALTNMNDINTNEAIIKLGVSEHIVKANSSPGKIVDRIKAIVGDKIST